MKPSQSIKPISYLKQHTAEALRHVSENHNSLVITQNGEAKAILMDIKEFEQTQETLALLKLIAQSKVSYQAGEHKPVKKAFADIRKRIKESSR